MTPPLKWLPKTRCISLLDQTQLPAREVWLDLHTPEDVGEAILSLRVRGAPAIGIAAAYGAVLAACHSDEAPYSAVVRAIDLLESTRPTAVNLTWALDRMRGVAEDNKGLTQEQLSAALLKEAQGIETEDRAAGQQLGHYGLQLLAPGDTVLTHCHTGGVATSGYGTALAPLVLGAQRGIELKAYVDETRPLLQGSRITAWELARAGVAATLITDSMAGHVMRTRKIDAVLVGADRIAANGDVANKIGTYALAVLARAHEVPFYVSAPMSTIDFATPTGSSIVIEERAPSEVTHGFGLRTAPEGVDVYNPAFDITPADYVTTIITEKGIVRPPYTEGLRGLTTSD